MFSKIFFMKRNMGIADRVLRIVIALVIGVLYYFKIIEGVLGSALLALAGIFLATGLLSFCPLYTMFGIRTCVFRDLSPGKK
jgi:hypothetical protein